MVLVCVRVLCEVGVGFPRAVLRVGFCERVGKGGGGGLNVGDRNGEVFGMGEDRFVWGCRGRCR